MYICALIYVRTNVKTDCTESYIYIYIYIIVHIYIIIICNFIYNNVWIRGMEQRYGTDVWNRGMERILQGGMERGYGTGVWNGCGPGACSGPPILTCPYMYLTFGVHYLEVCSIIGGNFLDPTSLQF